MGALLKNELRLCAIRRGSGQSPRNITHYRFSDDDERLLTEWMQNNLVYGFALVTNGVEAIESRLIADP